VAKQPSPDDRFAELVSDQFGVFVTKPGASEDKVHAAAAKPSRHHEKPKEWFSLDNAIEQAEPEYEPWDQFKAPTPPPLQRPRHPLVIAGLGALVLAIAVAVLWIVGVPLPVWVRGVGGLLIGAALACFLLALPRHRTPDGDGAVI